MRKTARVAQVRMHVQKIVDYAEDQASSSGAGFSDRLKVFGAFAAKVEVQCWQQQALTDITKQRTLFVALNCRK